MFRIYPDAVLALVLQQLKLLSFKPVYESRHAKKTRKRRILPTHLGFLQVIGQTSIPDGLEGLQKKSAYCAQFIPSVQLARGARVKQIVQ